ncbi:hypothetical protein [Rhodococcus sovatensis]|uniref:Membrane protein involved in the export of O-antigen and teichoic acid n=1 Tax=Rhodococcus sovatensis TaxID=1805840 RepID=A0ABZ2PMZ3_9NOCA
MISRELGPEGRGVYATCLAALSLSPVVVGLGIPMAVRRLASVGEFAPVVRVCYRIAGLLVSPAFAIGAVVAIFLLPEIAGVDRTLFLVAMGVSALFVVVLCVQSALIAKQRYRSIAVLQFVQPGVTAFFVIFFWLFSSLSISHLMLAYIAGTVTAVAISLGQIRVSVIGPRLSMISIGREGIKYAGSQIAETASNTIVLLFAAVAMGALQTGLLSVAMTLAAIPLAGGYAVGSAVFKNIASASPDRLQYVRRLAIRTAVYGGSVIAVILSMATPIGVPFLFGAEFRDSVSPALILILGSPLLVVNYVATQVLGAEGRGRTMTVCQLAGILVSLVGLFTLSPAMGAVGGAVGVLLGWTVTMAGSLAALRVGPSVLVIGTRDIKASLKLCLKGTV